MFGRLVIYFSAWLLAVPWTAAWCWLTFDRLAARSGYSIWIAAGDGAFGAFFGVAFSLVLTVPLSALVMFAYSLLPRLKNVALWRRALLVGLAGLGTAWSIYQVQANGFQQRLWVAGLIGLLAGIGLAFVSHALLGASSKDATLSK